MAVNRPVWALGREKWLVRWRVGRESMGVAALLLFNFPRIR